MAQPLLDTVHLFGSSISHKRQHGSLDSTYHIYFIPGNPGLIAYYQSFLNLLNVELSSALKNSPCLRHGEKTLNRTLPRFEIHGKSLGGFELGNVTPIERARSPLGLQDQIQHVDSSIASLAGLFPTSRDNSISKISGAKIRLNDKIILIGHSVGAYILLEILRRRKDGFSALPNPVRAVSRESNETERRENCLPFVGGICLFPTVVDIAKSDNGRKLSWFLMLPDRIAIFLGVSIGLLAMILTFCIPFPILVRIVGFVTGFPEDAARTTAAFLKSRSGVRQAVHMGREELQQIQNDRWGDSIWGSEGTPKNSQTLRSSLQDKPIRLFFYFGNYDQWVDNQIRDMLIAKRGFSGLYDDESKPKMEIDRLGVPHSFCVRHNYPIAKIVAKYIADIITADQPSRDFEDMTMDERRNYPMVGF